MSDAAPRVLYEIRVRGGTSIVEMMPSVAAPRADAAPVEGPPDPPECALAEALAILRRVMAPRSVQRSNGPLVLVVTLESVPRDRARGSSA